MASTSQLRVSKDIHETQLTYAPLYVTPHIKATVSPRSAKPVHLSL